MSTCYYSLLKSSDHMHGENKDENIAIMFWNLIFKSNSGILTLNLNT